jgi:drug/metabolite transporter (DMT)-like permease
MILVLFFMALFFLSQSSNWVRWSQSPIEVLGFWRLAVACALLLCWNARRLYLGSRWVGVSRRSLFFALSAGILLFAHLWTYKYQAHHTRIANGMILFAANPLFTALASTLFFREKLTPRLILAYLLSLSGIYYLVSHQLRFEPATLDGDLVALLSGALYSAYLLASQQARRELQNFEFSMIHFAMAAVCFLGLGAFREVPMMPTTPQAWGAIVGLAVFSTILGHGLFSYLLQHMNINILSCGKLLEPAMAAVAAWLLFGEEINQTMVVSFALTAIGVVVLLWKKENYAKP